MLYVIYVVYVHTVCTVNTGLTMACISQWDLSIRVILGHNFSPYYRGSPQIRGHFIHYSATLGHRMVSLL